MNGENVNDEYSKKITDLMKILEEEKATEDIFQEDKQFNEEIKKLEENQQKEILSLQKDIEILKNNNNNIIINSNYEINESFIKIIQDKIMNNIQQKLESYFNLYDKNMEEKIIQMKKKINSDYGNEINNELNKIKLEIEKINEKIIQNCISKQKEINDNLKRIQLELGIEKEKPILENKDNNIKMDESLKDSTENMNISNMSKENEGNSNAKEKNKYQKRIIKDQKINRKSGAKNNGENKRESYNIKSSFSGEMGLDKSNLYENDIHISNQNNNKNPKEGPIDNKRIYQNQKDSNFQKFMNSNTDIKTKKDNSNYNTNKGEDEENISEEIPEDTNKKAPNFFQKQKKYFYNRQSNPNQNKPNAFGSIKNNDNDTAKKLIDKTNILGDSNQNKPKKTKQHLSSLKNIFFIDNLLNHFNKFRINEYDKEIIKKEWIENPKDVEFNCIGYIKSNVIPKMKRYGIDNNTFDILKKKISTVLECIGIDKNYFDSEYYNGTKPKTRIDRNKSQQAVILFRRKFNIGEDVITDAGLESRLIKNNLNMEQTFQDMFD